MTWQNPQDPHRVYNRKAFSFVKKTYQNILKYVK